MALNKQAQLFADAAPAHLSDPDFPNFCAPLIVLLMKEGHDDKTIAEAMVDGMSEALKDIEPMPEGQREPMIAAAQNGIIAQIRGGFDLAQRTGAEFVLRY